MRRDYLIAIILAVAAFPAGAALMVAPEYHHLTGVAVPLTFWGGTGLFSALILLAAIIAWRGREKPPALSRYREFPRDTPLLDAIWRVYMGEWAKREKIEMGDNPNSNPKALKLA
jgi:hypothetical protein